MASLLTMNPLAAIGGRIILHAGAVLKGVELPPHQAAQGSEGYPAGTMAPAG